MTTIMGLPRSLGAEAHNAKAAAFWSATAAGAMAGAAYTFSPTTIVFLLVTGGLLWWAQRGTSPPERRWVLGVLIVALAARLAVLAGFFLLSPHREVPVLIGDEWLIKWRSLLLLNMALGRPLAPTDYINVFETYGRTGLMDVFAYWQLWFGPAPYGAHLVNCAMWFGGAIALYRTARRGFGPLPAIGGLVTLLYMPTLFVWSISALKEPPYFFLTAVTIAGATAVFRARRLAGRIGGFAAAAFAIVAIEPIRPLIAFFVTAGGVAVGCAGWLVTRRAWLAAAAILVVVAAGVRAQRDPGLQAELMRSVRLAANRHLGNVQTVGYAYKLLDPKFYIVNYYTDPVANLMPDEAGRFTVRALVSFFAVPLPWNAQSKGALALVPQQVVWYVLAVLACIGLGAGWRRDAIFTWLLVGNILVGGAVVALFNGNVGTLVRFRDSVVVIIVWLSALGGCALIEGAARRASRDSQQHAHSG